MNAAAIDVRGWQRFDQGSEFAPDERLGWFELLLADLSTTFSNVPSEQTNSVLQDALKRVADAFDLGRTALWAAEDGDLVRSHDWTRPGIRRRVWLPAPARVSARELLPWSLEKANAGELLQFSSVNEVPNEVDRASYQRFGTKSMVAVPFCAGGRTLGLIAFSTVDAERSWPSATVSRLHLIASVFAGVVARRQSDESLRTALAQVAQLQGELQTESVSLPTEMREQSATGIVIGGCPAVRRVEEQVRQVAATDSTVLLLGETGSGKEMFASRVHDLSSRRDRPMVRVNCAAIPATLIESELFGREKGAYTGALARQIGRFEMADQSTIFLDEIGDLPLEIQVKLLRVLEEKQIERLGSPKPIRVDTRIIAATHRDLEQRIAEGTFREDLYYRLCVFPIHVPPLRERLADIPRLVWQFVEEFAAAFGKRIDSIGKDDMAALQQYPWPGNIRELRNVVERAMIVGTGPRLTFSVPATSAASTRRSPKLADVEREHIRSVLEITRWRIRGTGGAAETLGLLPTTLETRMAKLGLKRPH